MTLAQLALGLPNHVATRSEARDLFLSSQVVKGAIDNSPRLSVRNPLLASDLGLDAVEKIVINFLAWVTGLCCDPLMDSEGGYVMVEDDTARRKLFSLCQDVIYLKCKGRKLVPKHLILGMTIRHITGSSKLIDIVSGLGHCMSSQAIVDYDSDLAKYRAQQELIIPRGFTKSFATCVYDNNDIKKETLTGKGTTHCTTGILIQRTSECSDPVAYRGKEAETKKGSFFKNVF